jgi:hypothetical protein
MTSNSKRMSSSINMAPGMDINNGHSAVDGTFETSFT